AIPLLNLPPRIPPDADLPPGHEPVPDVFRHRRQGHVHRRRLAGGARTARAEPVDPQLREDDLRRQPVCGLRPVLHAHAAARAGQVVRGVGQVGGHPVPAARHADALRPVRARRKPGGRHSPPRGRRGRNRPDVRDPVGGPGRARVRRDRTELLRGRQSVLPGKTGSAQIRQAGRRRV
ncbi:MAG: hypothetical protein AVDCRST_MAG56-212, partial [uncultured Cytophagales bacterium]